jgi:hypothetical protein
MTKFILVLYMCSVLGNNCPNSHIPGYSFTTHTACVEYGYRLAYSTFRALEETEEMTKEYVENSKIVVKFECREVIVPEEKQENTPKKQEKNT